MPHSTLPLLTSPMTTPRTGAVTLYPPPRTPPACFLCSRPSRRYVTRKSNRKGNARRPYYKCDPCNKFLVFADERGNEPRNPTCDCGLSSKRQLTGPVSSVSRKMHFVCREGACDYWKGAEREELDNDIVEQLVNLRIV